MMALRSTPRALGISQYGEGRGPDSREATFASMDTPVQLENVTKRYGGTRALRECTLAIPGGHMVALDGIAFVAQDTPSTATRPG
jgi:hypothetical protein